MTGAVLVTGSGGFVGRAVVERLAAAGVPVRAASRRAAGASPGQGGPVEWVETGDIDGTTDWRAALRGAVAVVHCAARVHVQRDAAADPLAEFRRVNRDATAQLARQAAEAGVGRFVYISSIGVNGAETQGRPFTESDPPAPGTAYARSKHEAELELREIAKRTGLAIAIVRPPLVYGPAAPGNFRTLMRAVWRGLPLPLGSIDNRRAFIAIDNLVDLIAVLLRHPAAAGRVFLASDGEDLSTSELLRRTARALGRPARLFPMPAGVIRLAARLLGRAELGQRLCGSLQIDISETVRILGWTPPVAVDDALVRTAQHFLHSTGGSP